MLWDIIFFYQYSSDFIYSIFIDYLCFSLFFSDEAVMICFYFDNDKCIPFLINFLWEVVFLFGCRWIAPMYLPNNFFFIEGFSGIFYLFLYADYGVWNNVIFPYFGPFFDLIFLLKLCVLFSNTSLYLLTFVDDNSIYLFVGDFVWCYFRSIYVMNRLWSWISGGLF